MRLLQLAPHARTRDRHPHAPPELFPERQIRFVVDALRIRGGEGKRADARRACHQWHHDHGYEALATKQRELIFVARSTLEHGRRQSWIEVRLARGDDAGDRPAVAELRPVPGGDPSGALQLFRVAVLRGDAPNGAALY